MTIFGTIENEGPVVVKTHLAKMSKDVKAGKMSDEMRKYGDILLDIKNTFNLFKHPNVMPYQMLIRDSVFFYNSIVSLESCFNDKTIFPL